jgi:hypothetical protein
MADTYRRVPVDPQKPLGTGLYEITLSHQSGDLSKVTRSSLEKALQKKYGSGVRVLDWGKRGGDLVIRLEVKGTSTSPAPSSPSSPPAYGGGGCGSIACPQPMAMAGEAADYIYPAFLPALPAILSVAAIVAMLYLVWRIVTAIKESVQLIPEPARTVAVAGGGVGVAALGLGVLVLAVAGLRRGHG